MHPVASLRPDFPDRDAETNIGADRLAGRSARGITTFGFIETPYRKVVDGKSRPHRLQTDRRGGPEYVRGPGQRPVPGTTGCTRRARCCAAGQGRRDRADGSGRQRYMEYPRAKDGVGGDRDGSRSWSTTSANRALMGAKHGRCAKPCAVHRRTSRTVGPGME